MGFPSLSEWSVSRWMFGDHLEGTSNPSVFPKTEKSCFSCNVNYYLDSKICRSKVNIFIISNLYLTNILKRVLNLNIKHEDIYKGLYISLSFHNQCI